MNPMNMNPNPNNEPLLLLPSPVYGDHGILAHIETLELADKVAGGLRVHYQLWIAPNLEEIRADIRGALRYEIESRIQSGDLWAWPILTCVAHVDGFKETETVSGEATRENGTWRGFKEFQACGDWMLLRAEAIEDLGKQVAAMRMLKADRMSELRPLC